MKTLQLKHIRLNDAFVDYDAVEQLFLFLVWAALRKRVVTFDSAKAACQGKDHDQAMRGNERPDAGAPDSSDMQEVINTVADQCLTKGWPPLTVLITKEGKNVSQGFWFNTPLGDLSAFTDEHKRTLELAWRQSCLDFFDGFSALGQPIQQRVNPVLRLLNLRNDEFPGLKEAFDDASKKVVNGGQVPLTYTELDHLIRRTIRLNPEGTAIVGYDANVLIDRNKRNTLTRTISVKIGDDPVNVYTKAFQKDMAITGYTYQLTNFNVIAVLDGHQNALDFKCNYDSSDRGWNYSVEVDRLVGDSTVKASIAFRVDPATGTFTSATSDTGLKTLLVEASAIKHQV